MMSPMMIPNQMALQYMTPQLMMPVPAQMPIMQCWRRWCRHVPRHNNNSWAHRICSSWSSKHSIMLDLEWDHPRGGTFDSQGQTCTERTVSYPHPKYFLDSPRVRAKPRRAQHTKTTILFCRGYVHPKRRNYKNPKQYQNHRWHVSISG